MRGRRARRAFAAFTLIEILIAIVILAIGLLGLGVVFPVVIRQQRLALEAVSAEAAMGQIEAQLRANRAMRVDPPEEPIASTEQVRETRWGRVAPARTNGAGTAPQLRIYLPESNVNISSEDVFEQTGSFGGFRFGMEYVAQPEGMGTDGDLALSWDNSGGKKFFIPLSQRLVPSSTDELRRPQFVWDMALLRPNTDRLKAVVFLRRVSTGIRAPLRLRDENEPDRGAVTVTDVLLGRYDTDARLPVALDADGRSVAEGVGDYSPVLAMSVDPNTSFINQGRAVPDLIVPDYDTFGWPSAAVKREALSRAGQRLVLVTENGDTSIHEVLRVTEDGSGGSEAIQVDPPLPVTTPRNAAAWKFMLYTIEPPVAIREVELEVRP